MTQSNRADPTGGDATVSACSRRRFLGWAAAAGVGLLPAPPEIGDAHAEQAPEQPVVRATSTALSIEARAVQIGAGPAPDTPNAWVYCGAGAESGPLATAFGPTFEQRRDVACRVTYSNALTGRADGRLPVPPGVSPLQAPTCGGVIAQSDVGVVAHLHGARVLGNFPGRAGESDGWPLAPMGCDGNPFHLPRSRTCIYPNRQRATLLWYHDHAMDHTGEHVHAGLVGLYFIRDAADDALLAALGGAAVERPLVIQDRVVSADGRSFDYEAGRVDYGPHARPEFLGDRLFVNGRPAGRMALARRAWRLRLLNGCNARTVALALCDVDALARGAGRVWWSDRLHIVGADGGLLARPVRVGATDTLILAPAQRRDVIVDLSDLPPGVRRLRLVNLALRSYLESGTERPEDIYSTFARSVTAPSGTHFSRADSRLYGVLGNGRAVVAEIDVAEAARPRPTPSVEHLLAAAAADDDFAWNGSRLVARPGVPFGPNRLVLLLSNTADADDYATLPAPPDGAEWSDVQIFELSPGGGSGPQWQLPFDVDLATAAAPVPGGPGPGQVGYTVSRGTFFDNAAAVDVARSDHYPPSHAPTIQARAGTYERWYVANVGNTQPLVRNDDLPDMHPFHVHLVNFVVLRRWELDGPRFRRAAADPLDAVARQDTVLIPSDTLVELLVFFPPGYSGDYPYHCHILEHEDNCMMSTFRVT